jgi:hypothetical protein
MWDMAETLLVPSETSRPVIHTHMLYSILKPAEIANPYFQNQSCDPFTPESKPCVLGNLASYSINVSSANDIIAGIKFATENNIRLSIKNTGHE